MDSHIHGYRGAGLKDFSANVTRKEKRGLETIVHADEEGVITVYQQLPQSTVGNGFDDITARCYAHFAIQRLVANLEPFLAGFPFVATTPEDKAKRQLDIKGVALNRWPFSIHQVRAGAGAGAPVLVRRSTREAAPLARTGP
jgi:hypothetical protein